MSTQAPGPFGQPAAQSSQITLFPAAAGFDADDRTYEARQMPDQADESYVLPNSVYGGNQWGSDAQIAARKAMAKRNSKSFSARVSRTKSRKEKFGRLAKPGIKVDTSFTRHKGNAPRQVYPLERGGGTVKKSNWWSSLARSTTRSGKGLGITAGDHEQIDETSYESSPKVSSYKINTESTTPYENPRTAPIPQGQIQLDRYQSENYTATADSLTPGSKAWFEVSPSDRPIPIGISLPSDSIPDFSPYQSTRQRSASDATLVTPNIVVTPAAMKSVWSPDTASDYTPGRSSSIYSRALFNAQMESDIPPVPALPTVSVRPAEEKTSRAVEDEAPVSHVRTDTLDSALTAFEEDSDTKRKDRIMSTGTVFEEDETPLTLDTRMQALSSLSLDTSIVPTPRRSRGWWNVITTPFELSRHNSVWTNFATPKGDRTPDVPLVPQNFGAADRPPSTPSTYLWSATDRSTSTRFDSPLIPTVLQGNNSGVPVSQPAQGMHVHDSPAGVRVNDANTATAGTGNEPANQQDLPISHMALYQAQHATPVNDRAITSPLSATTATPILRTAALGTVVMPHGQPREINLNVEFKNHRPEVTTQLVHVTSRAASTANPSPEVSQSPTPDMRNLLHKPAPQFAPPPTVAYAPSRKRAQDVESIASSAPSIDLKGPQTHRKLSFMEWIKLKIQKSRKSDKNKQRGDKKKGDNKKRKSRRCCCLWGCCCLLLLCLIAILVPVVVVVSRRHNHSITDTEPPASQAPPSQSSAPSPSSAPPAPFTPSQWLNLTGYPPIPTGLSTVAQPEAVKEITGCVSPATIWSCALPKEEQVSIAPNKPDQPNFKLEIVFDKDVISDPSKTRPARRVVNAASAGSFVRSLRSLIGRAAPSPSPAPPSTDDQKFIGNTTDGNSAPFEGEQTPFFISFLSATNSSRQITKRAAADIGNITDIIPEPAVSNDGTAAPAALYPTPSSQPLRLYNRGKENEHYGFYTYFDRSIFLKSIDPSNSSFGGVPADTDGGSPFDAASLRCTWSQTRFLVQIWTRSESTKPLLQGLTKPSADKSSLKRPGSFPYPVTVTIDRHGGSNKDKMIYCYEMDQSGKQLTNRENKKFVLEDRSFGGLAVNPSNGPLKDTSGGIDGGKGGCACQWQNWLA